MGNISLGCSEWTPARGLVIGAAWTIGMAMLLAVPYGLLARFSPLTVMVEVELCEALGTASTQTGRAVVLGCFVTWLIALVLMELCEAKSGFLSLISSYLIPVVATILVILSKHLLLAASTITMVRGDPIPGEAWLEPAVILNANMAGWAAIVFAVGTKIFLNATNTSLREVLTSRRL